MVSGAGLLRTAAARSGEASALSEEVPELRAPIDAGMLGPFLSTVRRSIRFLATAAGKRAPDVSGVHVMVTHGVDPELREVGRQPLRVRRRMEPLRVEVVGDMVEAARWR